MFEELEFSAYSQEARAVIAAYAVGPYFLFDNLLFWSYSSQKVRKNQSSVTFYLTKAFVHVP